MSEPAILDPNSPHGDALSPETIQGDAVSSAPTPPASSAGKDDVPPPSVPGTVPTDPASVPIPPPAPLVPANVPAPITVPAPVNVPAPIVPPPVKKDPPRAIQKSPPSNDPISKFRNKTVDDEARMGFVEHLLELRKRLWISIVAVLVCVIVALIFYKQVFLWLTAGVDVINAKYLGAAGKPFVDEGIIQPGEKVIQLTSTKPLSSMVMVIWLGFWAGLVVASPIILSQLWAFVAPGLHEKEKKAIKPVLYGGIFFFLTGAAVAYQFLGPMTMDFFVWLDLTLHQKVLYTSEEYVDLMLTMMIVSGLLCEIPLLVAALARLAIIEPGWMIKYWKVLTFGSVVLGMVVSPGNDLASMSAFSGLILGIYLVSIVMAYIFYKKPADPNAQANTNDTALATNVTETK